jgi:hypothetical protein
MITVLTKKTIDEKKIASNIFDSIYEAMKDELRETFDDYDAYDHLSEEMQEKIEIEIYKAVIEHLEEYIHCCLFKC